MNKLWCGQISDNKVLNQFLLLLTHCLIMSYIVSYLMRVNSLSNRELTKYEQVLKAESKAKQKYSAFMLTKKHKKHPHLLKAAELHVLSFYIYLYIMALELLMF